LNEDNERYTEEKEKTLRSQAIREILTTEVTYLQQLETLTEVLFNIHIFFITMIILLIYIVYVCMNLYVIYV